MSLLVTFDERASWRNNQTEGTVQVNADRILTVRDNQHGGATITMDLDEGTSGRHEAVEVKQTPSEVQTRINQTAAAASPAVPTIGQIRATSYNPMG